MSQHIPYLGDRFEQVKEAHILGVKRELFHHLLLYAVHFPAHQVKLLIRTLHLAHLCYTLVLICIYMDQWWHEGKQTFKYIIIC